MELFWSLSLHKQYGKYKFPNKCSILNLLIIPLACYKTQSAKEFEQRNMPHKACIYGLCGAFYFRLEMKWGCFTLIQCNSALNFGSQYQEILKTCGYACGDAVSEQTHIFKFGLILRQSVNHDYSLIGYSLYEREFEISLQCIEKISDILERN